MTALVELLFFFCLSFSSFLVFVLVLLVALSLEGAPASEDHTFGKSISLFLFLSYFV